MKGVPVRVAIGLRDLENNTVELARRDTREKFTVPIDGLANRIVNLLDEVQQSIFNKAKAFRDSHITRVDSWDEFVKVLEEKGGFVSAFWDGTEETEAAIKEKQRLPSAAFRSIIPKRRVNAY